MTAARTTVGDIRTLETRVAALQRETDALVEENARLEIAHESLSARYVALRQLFRSLERDRILLAIQDVIVNLIGSEEFGIFELSGDATLLHLISRVGIDAGRWRSVSVHSSVIGRVALHAESFYSTDPDAEVTACTPLQAGGHVTGVIALFRLLEQRAPLTEEDRELLEDLATYAAAALYASAGWAAGRAPRWTRP